jgi:NADPH:quinone reductase-like Zn-dependent oxidoreductase
LEASGVVTAVGKDVTSISVGDHVMALLEGRVSSADWCAPCFCQLHRLLVSSDCSSDIRSSIGGGYAEYCTAAAAQVVVLPASFDLTTAGGIMEVCKRAIAYANVLSFM